MNEYIVFQCVNQSSSREYKYYQPRTIEQVIDILRTTGETWSIRLMTEEEKNCKGLYLH